MLPDGVLTVMVFSLDVTMIGTLKSTTVRKHQAYLCSFWISLESLLFHNNFAPFQPFNWSDMVLTRRRVTIGLSVTVGANSGVKMDTWGWREKPTLHVVLIALLLWVLVVLMMAMTYSPSAVNVVSYLMCVTQLVSLMSRALKKGNISLAYSAKCCTCLWWLNKGVHVLLLLLLLTLSY